jgi:hypothetical protein
MEHLTLSDITGPLLWRPCQITTLEALSLAGTAAGPAALDHLSALPRLRRLDLSGCARIDGDALSCVARISSLEALELRDPGGAVGAAGLRHVAALPRLRELDLGARFVVDDAAAEGLAGGCLFSSGVYHYYGFEGLPLDVTGPLLA